jgi:hypothetical protein
MREPNDRLLTDDKEADLDLVLGGHDHDYLVYLSESTGTLLCKRSVSVSTLFSLTFVFSFLSFSSSTFCFGFALSAAPILRN